MQHEYDDWSLERSLREGHRLADEDLEEQLRAELRRDGLDDSLYEYDRVMRRLVLPWQHGGRY